MQKAKKEGRKKVSEFDSYGESPYLYRGFELKRRDIKSKPDKYGVDPNTGEVISVSYSKVTVITKEDELKYCKVYLDSLSGVREFSIPALKVWCYILQSLRPGRESVFISNAGLMEYCGYTAMGTAYIGIVELIERDFIQRATGTGNYWINPNCMYNGRRKTEGLVPDLGKTIRGWGARG